MKEKDKEGSWVTHSINSVISSPAQNIRSRYSQGWGLSLCWGMNCRGCILGGSTQARALNHWLSSASDAFLTGPVWWWAHTPCLVLRREKILHHGWIFTSNFSCLFTFLRAWPHSNCLISPKIVVFQLMVSCSLDLCFIHCYGQETQGPVVGRIVIQSPTTYIFVEVFPLRTGKVWEYGDELSLPWLDDVRKHSWLQQRLSLVGLMRSG